KRAKSRPSGPSAVLGVADALHELANSFKDTEEGSNEHLRREKAARQISHDDSLSPTTRRNFLRLIRKDLAPADIYLGMDKEDERAAYVHDELIDFTPFP
ncbi:hypothetical protein SCHPADRAFT_834484, partial [Schizopora paradoxa]